VIIGRITGRLQNIAQGDLTDEIPCIGWMSWAS